MFGPFGEIERVVCTNMAGTPQPLSAVEARSPADEISGHRPFLHWLEARLRAWRWGTPVGSWCVAFVVATAFASVASNGDVYAAELDLRFDMPALLPAVSVSVGSDPTMAESSDENTLKIVRLVIPVTTEISAANRDHVGEFRYDVQWHRGRFPLVEYAPRTQTTSVYEGNIAVEEQTDRSATLGFALTGGQHLSLSGSGKAEAANRKAKKTRYQEIPQQDVLVASGTTDRGTGAFFRFHRSREETLEGSRELSVAFRVPSDWRAGLLRVKCQAFGSRRVLGIWDEPLEAQRSFTLPVYLEGDQQAHDSAVKHVRKQALVAEHRAGPKMTALPVGWLKL